MFRRNMLLGADLQSKNRHVLPVCLLGLLPELEGVSSQLSAQPAMPDACCPCSPAAVEL